MSGELLLIYGDEYFLIDDQLEGLKKQYVAPGMESFAYEMIRQKDIDINNLVNVIQTLPSFSPHRLIVIKDFEYLGRKALDDQEEGLLTAALDNIPDGVVVAFVVYGNVDKRKKFSKYLMKTAKVSEHKSFASWEQEKLFFWLQNVIEKKGYKVSREALTILTQISGVSLRALVNEIEKIITYIGGRKNIEAADVSLMSSPGEIISFDLNDAVNAKDTKKILSLMHRMVKEGSSPVLILGMLVSQVRLLLQIKEGLSFGKDVGSIASKLRKSPYYIKKLAGGTNKYSIPELEKFYFSLHEADVKMKTGKLEQKLALELAVSGLAK